MGLPCAAERHPTFRVYCDPDTEDTHVNVRRLTHTGRKKIVALKQKRLRDEEGLCVVEGRRGVEAAVRSGARVVAIVALTEVLEGQDFPGGTDFTAEVKSATRSDFERMSDVSTSQGVLAVVETRWKSPATQEKARRIVVLDGVQDPGNVGTIVRTAAWFGIDGILCGPGVADCFGPKVLRSSMGSVWDVDLARSQSLPADLANLRAAGLHICAADVDGEPINAWRPRDRACLILGSEAHGPSPEVLEHVESRVRIPTRLAGGVTESLNVAVAAGIMMFRWTLLD